MKVVFTRQDLRVYQTYRCILERKTELIDKNAQRVLNAMPDPMIYMRLPQHTPTMGIRPARLLVKGNALSFFL